MCIVVGGDLGAAAALCSLPWVKAAQSSAGAGPRVSCR